MYDQITTTLNDSFNVSSVTDNGTGSITINWDTDFANANYAAIAVAMNTGVSVMTAHIGNTAQAVGTITVVTYAVGGPLTDCIVYAAAFGDQ